MLSELTVCDLAIIDRLEVSFCAGLNVVTGETGSGKSILIKALQLVLGARGGGDLVRAGCEQASVEALFDLSPDLRLRLAALHLPDDEQLVVRRVIRANGRSRATLNGHLVTSAQLKQLARGLVDISSQHEHHSLVDATSHLAYLDAFGHHLEGVAQVREAVALARVAQKQLADLQASLLSDNADTLRWQAQEIDRVAPERGELDRLDEELVLLENAERLGGAARAAEQALYLQNPSMCQQIGRHEEALARAAQLDVSITPLVERMAAARTELEELSHELGRYGRAMQSDPERLAEARERRRTLISLCRKHASDLDGVVEKRERIQERLDVLNDAERHLDRLQNAYEKAIAKAGRHAQSLSEARRSTAAALGTAITRELNDLGMGDARVEVAMGVPEASTGLVFEGSRLTDTGFDQVELLIAPNPGEPPRPLARVASGGELSRSLLAIKRVLAGLGPVGLYVFDEVDTGVGGAVAEAIAQKMAEVGRHHQVLCITHQAAIAAYGDAHYVVSKRVEESRTYSSVERLRDPPHDDRVEELARMLGGITITANTRATARELLREPARADSVGLPVWPVAGSVRT
jgi:DNA repair protein RecN (Recombination protein N)